VTPTLSYDKMQELSARSDHASRIISELAPPLKELSKWETLPALEVGNRDGGSAIVILYYLQQVPRTWFTTVDVTECPPIITEWVEKLGIPHKHWKMPQADFMEKHMNSTNRWGFVFLDADHSQATCSADIRKLIPLMERGGIIAVDDVNDWPTLPEFEGLERVKYEGVDQGSFTAPSHGQHICYWRKA